MHSKGGWGGAAAWQRGTAWLRCFFCGLALFLYHASSITKAVDSTSSTGE
jgi:hypothetical protein